MNNGHNYSTTSLLGTSLQSLNKQNSLTQDIESREEMPLDNFADYAKEKMRCLNEQAFAYKPDVHHKAKAISERRKLKIEIDNAMKTLRMYRILLM